jgi:hypothetical protein
MISGSVQPAGSVTNGTSNEVVITIQGRKHWLWRAVDQDGFVLDVLVQSRRNARAAKRLMRKLLGQGRSPAHLDERNFCFGERCVSHGILSFGHAGPSIGRAAAVVHRLSKNSPDTAESL